MVEDDLIDSIKPLTKFKLPTQPLCHFLRADEDMVYYTGYHDYERQCYRSYFRQWATILD